MTCTEELGVIPLFFSTQDEAVASSGVDSHGRVS